MPKQEQKNRLRETHHPILYEVNTRILVNELSAQLQKEVTLATIPDEILDEWSDYGFDAVWLMGVWTTGEIGKEIAKTFPGLQEEYRRALSDVGEEDISGSPYAVKAYRVSPALGGNTGLATLRKRLAKRGIAVILDFVGNHTARDHAWVRDHPEYYIAGVPGEEVDAPAFFFKTKTRKGEKVLAFGRDPTFPGWTDTVQLNHAHGGTRRALIADLKHLASMCDGLRCDMAMLMLSNVFARTWGERAVALGGDVPTGEFWKEAIDTTRAVSPGFVFIAEAYWNKEWDLQQLGFDYTYDKILYDRLLREGASAVRDHLHAELTYQGHSLRFIENHDEPRAARTLPSTSWGFAAATIGGTVPGMFLVHDGQIEGRLIRVPVQLVRRTQEHVDNAYKAFYKQFLSVLDHPVFRKGSWQLLDVRPCWHDNYTWQNYLIFWWEHPQFGRRLVVVNYAPHSGQCYAGLPLEQGDPGAVEFRDLLGNALYVRDRAGLASKGMYFDLPGYGIHIFEVTEGKRQTP